MHEVNDRSRDIGEFVPAPDDDMLICRCEEITKGEIRKAVHDGDVKTGSVMMGQIAGMIQEKKPMQQILNEMMESTEAVYQSLSKVMEEI